MRKFIILILLQACISGKSLGKNDHPIKIPFFQTEEGHIIIQAQVNGITGNFIFDTGAGVNLLTKDFADKVDGLTKSSHFYTGTRSTGEQLQGDFWISDELMIGEIMVDKEIFVVLDMEVPIDGLISLKPFHDRILTIDYTGMMLRIETADSYSTLQNEEHFIMPLYIDNDRNLSISIFTTILLGDALEIDVCLDTGAGSGVFRFSDRYMTALEVDSMSIRSAVVPSPFLPGWENRHYYTELSIMSDVNKRVMISNFQAGFIEGLIYEGIISMDWIGSSITIDFVNEQLLIRD